MFKKVFTNLLVLSIGGAVGYILTKRYYENLIDEEIESVKESFTKMVEKKFNLTLDKDGKKIEDKSEKNEVKNFRSNNNPLTRSSLEGNPYEQAKKAYNITRKDVLDKLEDEDETDEDDEEDTDDAGMTEKDSMDLSRVNRTKPYIIDDREFSDEFDHHDKISLYYYNIDDVLCEENEEIIDDIDGTIGYEALEELSTQTTVWVRNEPLAIDYEIISINKSYAEMVHGIGVNLSPREKYEKKKRRELDE